MLTLLNILFKSLDSRLLLGILAISLIYSLYSICKNIVKWLPILIVIFLYKKYMNTKSNKKRKKTTKK